MGSHQGHRGRGAARHRPSAPGAAARGAPPRGTGDRDRARPAVRRVSGSTSYHLRQLERYGFIVEDEDQPSKRERRWRAAAKLTSWDDADFVDQPEGREASDAMHDLQVRWLLKRDRQWRERRLEWDRAWLGARRHE